MNITRLIMVCGMFLLSAASTWGQLPNHHGQVWREYIFATNARDVDKPQGAEIISVIKRETGEAAWTGGGTMGLIGCDTSKLYVYHTPAMHSHVGDVVNRFTRPESRDVCFAAEVSFIKKEKNAKLLDIRQSLYKYLHPILTPDGKPAHQTHGATAFWVAKENVTAFQDALQTYFNTVMASPTDNLIQAPKIVMFNGQRGFFNDTTQKPFVTSVIPVIDDNTTSYQPVVSVVDEGTRFELFSLLTSDARSVSSDISLMFSCVDNVDTFSFIGVDFTDGRNAMNDASVTIQVPHVQKIDVAETGLVWPRDGMLVVFLTGIECQSERRVEYGVPIFSKIPYLNRLFKNTAIGRESVSIAGIITVSAITAQDRAVHAASTASQSY